MWRSAHIAMRKKGSLAGAAASLTEGGFTQIDEHGPQSPRSCANERAHLWISSVSRGLVTFFLLLWTAFLPPPLRGRLSKHDRTTVVRGRKWERLEDNAISVSAVVSKRGTNLNPIGDAVPLAHCKRVICGTTHKPLSCFCYLKRTLLAAHYEAAPTTLQDVFKHAYPVLSATCDLLCLGPVHE